MAKKRKVKKAAVKTRAPKRKKKAKSASVARAGRRAIDVGKAASMLATRVDQLRAEIKKLKKALTKRRKKRS